MNGAYSNINDLEGKTVKRVFFCDNELIIETEDDDEFCIEAEEEYEQCGCCRKGPILVDMGF